jgi:DNA-binding protein H-NS
MSIAVASEASRQPLKHGNVNCSTFPSLPLPGSALSLQTRGQVVKAPRTKKFDQLIKARLKIDAALQSMLFAEQQRLIETINDMSTAAKRSRGRTSSRGESLKGKKLPAKFRNPKNPRETWAGRGLKPRWLVAALKGGRRKLSDFAVK